MSFQDSPGTSTSDNNYYVIKLSLGVVRVTHRSSPAFRRAGLTLDEVDRLEPMNKIRVIRDGADTVIYHVMLVRESARACFAYKAMVERMSQLNADEMLYFHVAMQAQINVHMQMSNGCSTFMQGAELNVARLKGRYDFRKPWTLPGRVWDEDRQALYDQDPEHNDNGYCTAFCDRCRHNWRLVPIDAPSNLALVILEPFDTARHLSSYVRFRCEPGQYNTAGQAAVAALMDLLQCREDAYKLPLGMARLNHENGLDRIDVRTVFDPNDKYIAFFVPSDFTVYTSRGRLQILNGERRKRPHCFVYLSASLTDVCVERTVDLLSKSKSDEADGVYFVVRERSESKFRIIQNCDPEFDNAVQGFYERVNAEPKNYITIRRPDNDMRAPIQYEVLFRSLSRVHCEIYLRDCPFMKPDGSQLDDILNRMRNVLAPHDQRATFQTRLLCNLRDDLNDIRNQLGLPLHQVTDVDLADDFGEEDAEAIMGDSVELKPHPDIRGQKRTKVPFFLNNNFTVLRMETLETTAVSLGKVQSSDNLTVSRCVELVLGAERDTRPWQTVVNVCRLTAGGKLEFLPPNEPFFHGNQYVAILVRNSWKVLASNRKVKIFDERGRQRPRNATFDRDNFADVCMNRALDMLYQTFRDM